MVLCLLLIVGLLLLATSQKHNPATQPVRQSTGAKTINPAKHLAEYVATEILPGLQAERDKLLSEADTKIRRGIVELAEKFTQLRQARDWKDVAQQSETGRISIWLRHTHLGKGRSTRDYVPKNDRYSVLVIIQPPPTVTSAMGMAPLYPNLGLVGQVHAMAENADLDAVLKKLVSDSLKLLKDLDARSTAYQPATQE